MSPTTKILAADDDRELLDVISFVLSRRGYQPILARDGEEALARWRSEQPALALLDVVMPQKSGFEVCREIRRWSTMPIIMLTARDSERDIVRGLTLGADDYIAKPFSPRQLLARIQAVLRRSGGNPAGPALHATIGRLTLDLESHQARLGDREVHLTPLEAGILNVLALHRGRVVSTQRLVDYVWGFEGGDSSLIKTHVSHIRRKLDALGANEVEIRAIPGVGYSLTVQDGEQKRNEEGEAAADR